MGLIFHLITYAFHLVVASNVFQCDRSFLTRAGILSRAPFNHGKRPRSMIMHPSCPKLVGRLTCCDAQSLDILRDAVDEFRETILDLHAIPYYQGLIKEIDNHIYTILERLAIFDYSSYEERIVDETFLVLFESVLNSLQISSAVYFSLTFELCINTLERFYSTALCTLCSPFDIPKATSNHYPMSVSLCAEVEANCSSSLGSLRDQREFVWGKVEELEIAMRVWEASREISLMEKTGSFGFSSNEGNKASPEESQDLVKGILLENALIAKTLSRDVISHQTEMSQGGEHGKEWGGQFVCSTFLKSLNPAGSATRLQLESKFIPAVYGEVLVIFDQYRSRSGGRPALKNAVVKLFKEASQGVSSASGENSHHLHLGGQQAKILGLVTRNRENNKKEPSLKTLEGLNADAQIDDHHNITLQHPSVASKHSSASESHFDVLLHTDLIPPLDPSFGVLHKILVKLPPQAQEVFLLSHKHLASVLSKIPSSAEIQQKRTNTQQQPVVSNSIPSPKPDPKAPSNIQIIPERNSREFFAKQTPRIDEKGKLCMGVPDLALFNSAVVPSPCVYPGDETVASTNSVKLFWRGCSQSPPPDGSMPANKFESVSGFIGSTKFDGTVGNGWCWLEPPLSTQTGWSTNRKRLWGWCTKSCSHDSIGEIEQVHRGGVLELLTDRKERKWVVAPMGTGADLGEVMAWGGFSSQSDEGDLRGGQWRDTDGRLASEFSRVSAEKLEAGGHSYAVGPVIEWVVRV
eukprot:GDKJ01015860.1.p1 GENE.GDKJ01015860.1~~GDKJ01015860.1.p1  ORF type:complete len:748 (-),score=126.92 GDKJ01015860.1:84-2327(-)